jgi:hypothetical protein
MLKGSKGMNDTKHLKASIRLGSVKTGKLNY